jgi:hypothetical protein
MPTTHTTTTTPGLARLRKHPKASAARAAVLSDQLDSRAKAKAKLAATTAGKPKKPATDSRSDPKRAAKGTHPAKAAGGKITVVDAKHEFRGETAKCFALAKAAGTVGDYMAAGSKAGVSSARLRFCLRHFAKTLKVVRIS